MVPPNERPITNINIPTDTVPSPSAIATVPNPRIPKTSMKVPINSDIKLYPVPLIAGPVQKTPNLLSLSSVASKCCLYITYTKHAPINAPIN
ncbi:hypothetical protein D3C76_1451990 [compost metagenome]